MASLILAALATTLVASDLDEYTVKREAVFEFAQKPIVTRQGDRVSIAFETQGFCDATVAIEDASGRIVRHLASGVLGPNAPEPFQRNSKKQVIVWDSKDDEGAYIDDPTRLSVRVSLGLRARFDRALNWEPKKRLTPSPRISWGRTGLVTYAQPSTPLLAATEEGVLVYDGDWVDHLRLFDHAGNYLRTVYPFPADKLERVRGLEWQVLPQDRALGQAAPRLPVKRGVYVSTFLTSGDNLFPHDTGYWGSAASAMAAGAGRIALVRLALNRLSVDGTTGGLPLAGPKVTYRAGIGRETTDVCPRSAALSPDGKWLYLTCYVYHYQAGFYARYYFLPGVVRLPMEEDAAPALFAGSMDARETGTDNARLSVPTSVACDREGRVYVSDYMNDRIQVFAPDGAWVKTIKFERPAQVALNQRTGEIYVGSWKFDNEALAKLADDAAKSGRPPSFKATLTRLGPLDDPTPRAVYPLPLEEYVETYNAHSSLGGQQYRFEIDGWADPPTIWLIPGAPRPPLPWEKTGVRVLAERDGQLVALRDFGQDTVRSVGRATRPDRFRQYLFVNPRTGILYCGERDTPTDPATIDLLRIDPETGAIGTVRLPFATYDLTFDLNGLAYLRFEDVVARFDPETWREVPFDYGEVRSRVGLGAASADVAGAVIAPRCRTVYSAVGGLSVSPNGRLALYTYGGGEANADVFKQAGLWNLRDQFTRLRGEAKPYAPQTYPGRMVGQEIHVWDKYGKVLFEDAIPGVAKAEGGVGLDRDDNLYIVASPNRNLDGQPYFRPSAGTWMKFKPRAGRFLCSQDAIPVPLPAADRPKRPPDGTDKAFMRAAWIEGVAAMYGGIGYFAQTNLAHRCMCHDTRFAFDSFARSFLPELDHYSVAVLDTNGNLILRIGQYGNADDGVPLAAGARGQGSGVREQESGFLTPDTRNLTPPPTPDTRNLTPSPTPDTRNLTPDSGTRSIGGDEVALFYPRYLATQTDRRLFIADPGNARIVSVRLAYHATERVMLKDVPSPAAGGQENGSPVSGGRGAW